MKLTEVINEANYQQIKGKFDDDFLLQKWRAGQLRGVKFLGFKTDKMLFDVWSADFNQNNTYYRDVIKFVDFDQNVYNLSLTPIQAARNLLNSDIEIHCTCPSFKVHGYQFILTNMQSALFPEHRPPNKTNPKRQGSVCKHLRIVLTVFRFYGGDLANYITQLRSQI